MKNLRNEYQFMLDKFPVGGKIIFDSFEFDKLGLKNIFFVEKGEYTIKKHGFFSLGDTFFMNLYFDKGVQMIINYDLQGVITYSLFKTLEKHFLRSGFDRAFWLGSKDERGFMFYDDYFYGKDPWKFFEDFLNYFCTKYFVGFDSFEDIDYEVEDAYCVSNVAEVLKKSGVTFEEIEKNLKKELEKREWIIDYIFDGDSLEIYYDFSEIHLEKRFSFLKNTSYLLKMVENNVTYDKKVVHTVFQREVEGECYDKEYIGMFYDEELSLIFLNVGIPLEESNFKRGE